MWGHTFQTKERAREKALNVSLVSLGIGRRPMWLEQGSKGKVAAEKGGEGAGPSPSLQNLLSHSQDLGFYSKCNRLSLDDFKQESDTN